MRSMVERLREPGWRPPVLRPSAIWRPTMVEIETPTDRAGEELVQNVKAHVRSVLNVPLQHQSAKAREVIVSQVTMAAVQACFAFLSAHDSYRNPRPLEFEDLNEAGEYEDGLPEVDVRADLEGGSRVTFAGPKDSIQSKAGLDVVSEADEFEDELPKARSPYSDG